MCAYGLASFNQLVAQLLSLKAAPVLCNACLRPLHSNLGSKAGTALRHPNSFMRKYHQVSVMCAWPESNAIKNDPVMLSYTKLSEAPVCHQVPQPRMNGYEVTTVEEVGGSHQFDSLWTARSYCHGNRVLGSRGPQ